MVIISADSTCDLSPELIERYGVVISPLYIIKDGREYKDGVEIRPKDIFEYVDTHGTLLKTAACSVSDYEKLFGELTADGNTSVVHVTISSHMSACYQNACLAAENFDNVYVVDSLNLSTGSGHIVIEGAIMAQAGVEAKEIKRRLDELTPMVEASFVVDRLDYLHKGGRCSSIAALGANLLKLKPCIEVSNGKMSVGKKYKGSFEKTLKSYVADRLWNRDDIAYERIFITHSACAPETVEVVRHMVEDEFGKFNQVHITTAGCTISNHCGPYTLGILFIRKPAEA